jgi:hypothetical protein
VNRPTGALLALLFLVLAGCGGGGTLDAEAFKREAEAIQSFAAEGALLARDVADGKSTAPFTRIHAGELAESAAKLEMTLATAEPMPAVEEKLAQSVALVKHVAETLKELEQSPGDAEAARRVQRELEAAAKEAEELAGA